ncbi:MAG: universal stress protein [Chloroflexi bacterium]|nr:universal stress protein [Chloroflexota bacterium]
MLKHLLVPLDGSPLAEHALPYAAALARALGARLTLLYARWPVVPESDSPDLDGIAARLRNEGIAVDARRCHLPSPGETGRTILEAAADQGADAVIMATHGRGGLGRLLYGSVTDYILRHSTLPVIVMSPLCERSWSSDRPLRVLVTLDGSELSEEVLQPLRELLGAARPELTMLRVAEAIDFIKPHGDECDACRAARARGTEPDIEPVRLKRYLESRASDLRAAGMNVEVETHLGPPASIIVRVADDREVDMIAMATRGRGGLRRVLLGSVTTETLRQARVPLLLVRPSPQRDISPEMDLQDSAKTGGSASEEVVP